MIKRKLKLVSIIVVVMVVTILVQYSWDVHIAQHVIKYESTVEEITNYIISVEFEEERMGLRATQKVIYTNNSEDTLNNIYFHLYPNTFRTEEFAPFEKSEMKRAYPSGFDPGYIKINELKVNKKRSEFRLMGDSSTLLRVSLNSPLEPGERVEIFMNFDVKLPNSLGRMGFGENTVNITNWFPIVSVYDTSGWNLDPYYPIGDPFYSDISNFEVSAIFPKEYVIATTGNIVRRQDRNAKSTYKISAMNVRNFVIIGSKYFDVKTATVDNILVKSYTINGLKGEESLQFAKDSIRIFNKLFGKYPYDQISVVATDFFIGGMEYPNLVMIGLHLYEKDEDFPLEYVIAHEIAHQWWYGIVGNNEAREPWLDEALTEYSTLMYFEEKYGEHIKEQVFEKVIKNQYDNFIDLYRNSDTPILQGLEYFTSSFEYSSIVYSKGAMFIEEIRKTMGDEAFRNAIKEYYNSFKFRNATTSDFFITFQRNTDENLKPLFKEWLNYTHE